MIHGWIDYDKNIGAISLSEGQTIKFISSGWTIIDASNTTIVMRQQYKFELTGNFKISGKLSGFKLLSDTDSYVNYSGFFADNSVISDITELSLLNCPQTTGMFQNLFKNCTSISQLPNEMSTNSDIWKMSRRLYNEWNVLWLYRFNRN